MNPARAHGSTGPAYRVIHRTEDDLVEKHRKFPVRSRRWRLAPPVLKGFVLTARESDATLAA